MNKHKETKLVIAKVTLAVAYCVFMVSASMGTSVWFVTPSNRGNPSGDNFKLSTKTDHTAVVKYYDAYSASTITHTADDNWCIYTQPGSGGIPTVYRNDGTFTQHTTFPPAPGDPWSDETEN